MAVRSNHSLGLLEAFQTTSAISTLSSGRPWLWLTLKSFPQSTRLLWIQTSRCCWIWRLSNGTSSSRSLPLLLYSGHSLVLMQSATASLFRVFSNPGVFCSSLGRHSTTPFGLFGLSQTIKMSQMPPCRACGSYANWIESVEEVKWEFLRWYRQP